MVVALNLDLPEIGMDPFVKPPYLGQTTKMLLVAMACALGLCAFVLSIYLGTVQPATATPHTLASSERAPTGYFPDQFDIRSAKTIESQPEAF